MAESDTSELTQLTVQLLSAYVGNNNVAVEDLAGLIASTRAALSAEPTSTTVEEPTYVAAVSIRKSLASPDHLLSLIDGKPYKLLKRHLATHGLTPEQYRARYNLPKDYPMVAKTYADQRRAVAERTGLGGRASKQASTSPNDAAASAAPTSEPANALSSVEAPVQAAPAQVEVKKDPVAKPAVAKAASKKPSTPRKTAAKPSPANPSKAKVARAKPAEVKAAEPSSSTTETAPSVPATGPAASKAAPVKKKPTRAAAAKPVPQETAEAAVAETSTSEAIPQVPAASSAASKPAPAKKKPAKAVAAKSLPQKAVVGAVAETAASSDPAPTPSAPAPEQAGKISADQPEKKKVRKKLGVRIPD